MDPTTTLITFLLQTDPSVQCVQLIGSWDNFSSCYAMTRDVRRGRDQWRGCYSFKDIVCDDETGTGGLPRNGGLRMGATYYYYYEVNGSTETHDPAEPWTTSCPFLPGQRVNTLTVPVERSLRKRHASLNSLHDESFKTMDPGAKFSTPRPPHGLASDMTARRLGSAPALLPHRVGPHPTPSAPSWKRLFTRRQPAQIATHQEPIEQSFMHSPPAHDASLTLREKTLRENAGRARDISPEFLRQFLSQESSTHQDSAVSPSPLLSIPDDTAEEADDDNFATSPSPENQPFVTSLSPPPFQRSASSDTMVRTITNSSSPTVAAPSVKSQDSEKMQKPEAFRGSAPPKLDTNQQIRWSISATSSTLTSPLSPQLIEDEPPSFYDSTDEDEVLSCNDGDQLHHIPPLSLTFMDRAFKGYSLPQQHDGVKTISNASDVDGLHSPRLLARRDSVERIDGANLLGTTIDTGLDDFASELGWIVDVIGTKQI